MKFFNTITLICVGDVSVITATGFFPSQDRLFAKRQDVQAYNSHAKDEASFPNAQKRLFYYYDQNPSGFCFLVQIRAFVFETSLGIPNSNIKGKTNRILVVVVK